MSPLEYSDLEVLTVPHALSIWSFASLHTSSVSFTPAPPKRPMSPELTRSSDTVRTPPVDPAVSVLPEERLFSRTRSPDAVTLRFP